jgi:hypothetical protein
MEELNKIISGLYAKIDNQEKIIRELQEKIILLKASGSMLELTKEYGEKNLYKQRIDKAIEYIKDYKKCDYSKYDENEIEIELIDKMLEILKGKE